MVKALILAGALVFGWLSVANAQVLLRPDYRKDGTYADGHYRSRPDGNPYNNYSYPGNVNPYTGREATGGSNTYLDPYQKRNKYGNNQNTSYNPYTPFRW